jgi:hypothetical protein
MTTMNEESARAGGYAAGYEDASGIKTAPAPGSPRGKDHGWMDFADAYAAAQSDYGRGLLGMGHNCKEAYARWQASGGTTIEDEHGIETYLVREARDWIADFCDFFDQAELDVAVLSDHEVRRYADQHYEGGWKAFRRATVSAYYQSLAG